MKKNNMHEKILKSFKSLKKIRIQNKKSTHDKNSEKNNVQVKKEDFKNISIKFYLRFLTKRTILILTLFIVSLGLALGLGLGLGLKDNNNSDNKIDIKGILFFQGVLNNNNKEYWYTLATWPINQLDVLASESKDVKYSVFIEKRSSKTSNVGFTSDVSFDFFNASQNIQNRNFVIWDSFQEKLNLSYTYIDISKKLITDQGHFAIYKDVDTNEYSFIWISKYSIYDPNDITQPGINLYTPLFGQIKKV